MSFNPWDFRIASSSVLLNREVYEKSSDYLNLRWRVQTKPMVVILMFTVGNLRLTIIEKWWYFPLFRSLISIAMILYRKGYLFFAFFQRFFLTAGGSATTSSQLRCTPRTRWFGSDLGLGPNPRVHLIFPAFESRLPFFTIAAKHSFCWKLKKIHITKQTSIEHLFTTNGTGTRAHEDFDGSFPRSSVANGTATPAQAATDIPGTNRGTSRGDEGSNGPRGSRGSHAQHGIF